jgi:hypothetical protein
MYNFRVRYFDCRYRLIIQFNSKKNFKFKTFEISNVLSALETLSTDMDNNRAWKSITDNIKI